MTTTSPSRNDAKRPPASDIPARTGASLARRIGSIVLQRYSLVLIWLIMIVVLVATAPGDVSAIAAMRAVLSTQTPLIFLGLAVVITMAVGEFDLSFAGIFGISAVTVPALVVFEGWPFLPAVLAAFGVALVFGIINAVLIVIVGINSVVVTLGVSSVAGGLAFLMSRETTVSGLDSALSVITLGRFLGLPMIFWYGVILVAIVAYIMSATPLGRHMLFVGSNRDVARLAGISVTRIRVGAYLSSALLCGLAGVILSIGLGGFNPGTAATNLMPTFAAVFLGTVAIVPGRFNPIGMLIAGYFLLTGVFGLQLHGQAGWVTDVFYGVVLVAAVTVSFLLQRRIRA
ncbi:MULTISPECIES: ABC transporter permease [unclassified Diaminobutyricimonas]|uniref:ABC transporter permease n=1 Tax=unclassified Diaminobutyricimonas TaxID=2643261 RepID=UPI0012F47BFE|nr:MULTISPECIES: ABC transporter permease [unclassified Diaminobutyricimonas]